MSDYHETTPKRQTKYVTQWQHRKVEGRMDTIMRDANTQYGSQSRQLVRATTRLNIIRDGFGKEK